MGAAGADRLLALAEINLTPRQRRLLDAAMDGCRDTAVGLPLSVHNKQQEAGQWRVTARQAREAYSLPAT